MATFIRPDGSSVTISPASGRAFSLKEMQNAVGGYIEILRLGDGRLMIVNEDGKRLQLAANRRATELAQKWLTRGDVIVGNVVIANDTEAGNDEPEED